MSTFPSYRRKLDDGSLSSEVSWARLRQSGEELPGYPQEEGVKYYVVHEGGPTRLVEKGLFEATYEPMTL